VFIAVALSANVCAAINYGYDAAGRLIQADYGNGSIISYTYDKAGNLLSRQVQNSTSAPVITLVANAFGDTPLIATNTWLEIKGSNLAPADERFLGTREIIGRVDVFGSDEDFQEASSRNQGLIDTPAVRQLREAVMEKCLKRLERYVVPVYRHHCLSADWTGTHFSSENGRPVQLRSNDCFSLHFVIFNLPKGDACLIDQVFALPFSSRRPY
jgi:YD repeat-containing protein